MNKPLNIIVLVVLFISPFCDLNSQTNDEAAQNYIEEAKTLFGKNAIPILELAQEVCKSGCADTIMGNLYRRMGVAYFQGRLDKEFAVSFTDKAIEYYMEAYGVGHPKVFGCQFNRSVFVRNLGRFDESAASLLGVIKNVGQSTLISQLERDSFRTIYLRQLATVYITIGDLKSAKNSAEEGLAFANKRWEEAHVYKAHLLTKLGYIYFEQQNYHAALPYYLDAIEMFRATSPGTDNFIRRHQSVGLCYFYLNDLEKAENYFEVVRNHYTSLSAEVFQKKASSYEWSLAYIYANFFILRIEQKKWEDAEDAYQKALGYARKLFPDEKDAIFGFLYKDRAILAEVQGNYEEALLFCRKAKQVALGDESVINSQTTFVGNSPYDVLGIIALEARLLGGMGNAKEAIEEYHRYSQFITLSRLRVRTPISKSFLLDSAKPVYEKAIALCVQEYTRTGALSYLEQAYQFNATNKAILLFEELEGEQAIQFSGIPNETVQEEKRLRHHLISTQRRLATIEEEGKDSLSQVFSQEQKNYDLLLRQMEQEYPSYYELKYAINQTIAPKLIQQKLDPNQALIEYFIGKNDLFVFILTAGELQVKQIPIAKGWKEDLLLLHELLTNSIEEDCEQQFIELSHRFYNWLVAPALADLPKEQINRLLIIPDDLFTLLPFEALLTKPVTEVRGANGFLLEKYALSYSYSSKALLQPKGENVEQNSAFFAGFGMEYDDVTLAKVNEMGLGEIKKNDLSEIQCEGQIIANRDLGYLKYSDDEIIGISELLGGDKWLNEAATKMVFMEQAGNYEILHLAMHGTIDPIEPLNSSLIFTYQDSSDFLLSAADIYTMDLNGQMVVLSACNTAAGNWSSGTGPMSLSRAFHYAGMPSVVASLWSIPDHSTAGLMRLFYDNLADGLPKDIALQQAKISYLNDDAMSSPLSRDPAFWAGLVVIGDASPLDRPGFGLLYWAIIAGLVALGLFLFWRKKND